MRAILVMSLMLILNSCATTSAKPEKINGVSFVASKDSVEHRHIAPVLEVNANYAAVMPFAFIKYLEHPEITYNTNKQWFGETKIGVKQYIKSLKKQRIKIMMKPQIWVWNGEYTGFIEMKTNEDWRVLEDYYRKFILDFAEVAQDYKVELFCIGTELDKFIENRPGYWESLIVEIKEVYKGKLTYAANWDEFKRTPFWTDLDFIGIDAYFPINEKQTPTVDDCKSGWQSHKLLIETYSKQFNKPVLFTEFGYRSVDYTAKEPWRADRGMTEVNLEAQVNATQALFEEFWKEDWFAGGFIWKWFHDHEQVGGESNSQFTPQNKPVETIIKRYYGLSSY